LLLVDPAGYGTRRLGFRTLRTSLMEADQGAMPHTFPLRNRSMLAQRVIVIAGLLCGHVPAVAQPNRASVDSTDSPVSRTLDRGTSSAAGENNDAGPRSLARWRAGVVNRLRAADIGAFEYHAYLLSDRQLRLAEMLSGRLAASQYATQENGPDFLDIYGFSKAAGGTDVIDWTATSSDPTIVEKSQYGTFSFSLPLAAAYWKTGDPIYVKAWFAIAGDFARNQQRQVLAIPAAKRRMDNAPWVVGGLPALHQGTRSIAMLRCLAAFAKSLPAEPDGGKPTWPQVLRPLDSPAKPEALRLIPAEDLDAIVHSLAVEHPKLLLESFYEPGAVPNQRFEGLAALVMLAESFPDAEGMPEVARKTNEAMAEYVTNGFNLDGGMVEPSLNYNVAQAERFRQLGQLLRRHPPAWLRLLGERLIGFQRLLVGLSTPMQELPVVGNNRPNPPAAWKGKDVREKWFDRRRPEGVRVDASALGFTSIAFPYSGYYVQRRDWAWDSPYLFLTNVRPARGHQAMDNLAIEVHAYGRPLLVQGGPPPYGLKFLAPDKRADAAKIEAYFNEESSYKFNTVIVDGYSQTRTAKAGVTPYEQPVPGRWHASTAFDLMDGKYALGYGIKANSARVDFSISHQRRVIHVRDLSCWVITDTMQSQDDQEHEYTQIWKFPPLRGTDDGHNAPVCGFTPEQVTFREGSIRTMDPAGPNLWLYQFANLPLTYTKHVGETNPYRGWYARFLGDLIPAVDMHATWRRRGRSVVTTLVWPTANVTPPPIKSFSTKGAETIPEASAFSAALRDGTILGFAESADGPRHLEACGIGIQGETILAVRLHDEVRGVVLGCTKMNHGKKVFEPTMPDFEFRVGPTNKIEQVAPVEVPVGFHWTQTHGLYRPVYRPSSPAADAIDPPELR